ncbi:hypothetical protein GIB67_028228 [Kingdonia uniflora]|uniref:KIB1-4 beta-propeller domain-containing protein n=1 Tax=Kingdonia uniflora TaxID=39325 RepID=A0A7J7KZ97_9MAGN|nr:hypothetical protein GIB67_028228 [Kingdonia uniflora]
MEYYCIQKVVFSSSPSGGDYIAMTIAGEFCKLAYCRAGDKKWAVFLENKRYNYEDMIYFKGQFYAINMGGTVEV